MEDEHQVDKIALLIGSAFVLGQVAITQAIAIVRGIRNLTGRPVWLPASKASVMALEATVHAKTGVSRIAVVNAVANYFKHHHEWPSDWVGGDGRHRQTIEMVRRLGLSPGETENLYTAARSLGFTTTEMQALGTEIEAWRGRLAERIRRELQLHDIV